MKRCEICSKKIEKQELTNQFKFSVGEFKKGKFMSKKSFYCHINCVV